MDLHQNNIQLQLDNITGWLSVGDYESALIKARCLVEALEQFTIELKSNEKNSHQAHPTSQTQTRSN